MCEPARWCFHMSADSSNINLGSSYLKRKPQRNYEFLISESSCSCGYFLVPHKGPTSKRLLTVTGSVYGKRNCGKELVLCIFNVEEIILLAVLLCIFNWSSFNTLKWISSVGLGSERNISSSMSVWLELLCKCEAFCSWYPEQLLTTMLS